MHTSRQDVGTSDRAIEALDRVLRYVEAGPVEDVSAPLAGGFTNELIRLGFRQHRILSEPFVVDDPNQSDDGRAGIYVIHVDDAFELEDHRELVAEHAVGLVPMGTTRDGTTQIMQNLIDGKLMGVNGNRLFTQGLIAGTAIEAATTPWNTPAHLHLVGFGELGRAIRAASVNWHAPELIHLYETPAELEAAEIRTQTALVFLQNITADEAFSTYMEVTGPRVGVLAGAHVRNALTFFHETNFEGTIEPLNLELTPVMVHEQTEEYASWIAMGRSTNDTTNETEAEPAETQEASEPQESGETPDDQTGRPPAPEQPAAADEPPEAESPNTDPVGDETADDGTLSTFGPVSVNGVTGQPAEAAAAVVFAGGQLGVEHISQALWPADPASGETARKRRTRTLKKLKDAGIPIEQVDDAWVANQLPTTVETATTSTNPAELKRIITGPPLAGCGQWADKHRERISSRVLEHLESVSDQALDTDDHQTVAAVAAIKSTIRGTK
ncbi:hypothetical protein [Arthrobacter castelli]|uniref:hypothetical protein n=1 Tax=Arthrobacter castelli TaxID=271431 RepID=UPI00040276F3|nr:hypothetical protein [Arthrobacter castelli]